MTRTRVRRLFTACAVAVTLGLLVGLVGPTPTRGGRLEVAVPAAAALPALSEVLFSATLHGRVPSIGRWGTDASFAGLARAVCVAVAAGWSAASIVASEHRVNPRLPDLIFGNVVYAGTLAFCPQLTAAIVTHGGR